MWYHMAPFPSQSDSVGVGRHEPASGVPCSVATPVCSLQADPSNTQSFWKERGFRSSPRVRQVPFLTGPKPDPWLSLKGPRQTPAEISLSTLGTMESGDTNLFEGRQWRERPLMAAGPVFLGLLSGTLLSRRQCCIHYSELLQCLLTKVETRWDHPFHLTSASTKSQGFSSQAKVWRSILCFMTPATFTSQRKGFFPGWSSISKPPVPAELAVQVTLQRCSCCIQNHTESCIRKCLFMRKSLFVFFFQDPICIESIQLCFFFLGNLFNYNKRDLISDDSLQDLEIYPELIQFSLSNVFTARCIGLLVIELPALLKIYFFVHLWSSKLFQWE